MQDGKFGIRWQKRISLPTKYRKSSKTPPEQARPRIMGKLGFWFLLCQMYILPVKLQLLAISQYNSTQKWAVSFFLTLLIFDFYFSTESYCYHANLNRNVRTGMTATWLWERVTLYTHTHEPGVKSTAAPIMKDAVPWTLFARHCSQHWNWEIYCLYNGQKASPLVGGQHKWLISKRSCTRRMVTRLQHITNTIPLLLGPIEKHTSNLHFKHSDREKTYNNKKATKPPTKQNQVKTWSKIYKTWSQQVSTAKTYLIPTNNSWRIWKICPKTTL